MYVIKWSASISLPEAGQNNANLFDQALRSTLSFLRSTVNDRTGATLDDPLRRLETHSARETVR